MARIAGKMTTEAQHKARANNLEKARKSRWTEEPQPPGPDATAQEIWRYKNRNRLRAYARAYYANVLRAKRQESLGK